MELPAKVALYVRKPEFLRWQDNPEEPRDWKEVARFLGLTGDDAYVNPLERLKEIRSAVQSAVDWCNAQHMDHIVCNRDYNNPIQITELFNLLDFLKSLTYRFPKGLGGQF